MLKFLCVCVNSAEDRGDKSKQSSVINVKRESETEGQR